MLTADHLVVFDVDDTLYLERDYVASGFRAVGDHVESTYGIDGFASAAWSLFTRGVRGNIFDRTLADLAVPRQRISVQDLVTVYRTHPPDIALLKDAKAAIAHVLKAGASLGFLTDGPVESQAAKVKALGLGELTEYIVLTGSYGPGFGKPHPRGFEDLERRSGKRSCTYVADNPTKDFGAPHSMGWRTIRVRREGSLHRAVDSGWTVDYEVECLKSTMRI